MKPSFEKDFFVRNRQKLREVFGGSAPIVISGNGLVQKSVDAAYPFRQDSNFWYLTGINEPGIVLVMDKAGDYLILPKQSQYMKTFDGEIDARKLQKQSGIDKVYKFEHGWSRLSKRLRTSKYVAGIEAPESFVEELDMYTNPARARLVDLIFEQNPSLRFIDVKNELGRLRMIKSDREIAAIRRSTEVTMKAFETLGLKLSACQSEYELAALATQEFMRQNTSHAYEPIVASGSNAVVLHYVANNRKFSPNELVLIDMGASFEGYASDISRTIGLNPSQRQLEVHMAVEDVNKHALSLVRPGASVREIEKQVRTYLGAKLVSLRLIKSPTKQAIRKYYPHATTHPVGLDVHDPMPKDGILRPGMVLTIEPGIYIKEESIGVRIEDIVLVTEDGSENLSGNLSRGAKSLRIS